MYRYETTHRIRDRPRHSGAPPPPAAQRSCTPRPSSASARSTHAGWPPWSPPTLRGRRPSPVARRPTFQPESGPRFKIAPAHPNFGVTVDGSVHTRSGSVVHRTRTRVSPVKARCRFSLVHAILDTRSHQRKRPCLGPLLRPGLVPRALLSATV